MRPWAPLGVAALAGCATYYAAQVDQRYGKPDPARYDRAAPSGAPQFAEVKSIIDNRCAV